MSATMIPAGEYHATYRQDMTVFPTRNSRIALWVGIALVACAPLVFGRYELGLLINIGFLGIACTVGQVLERLTGSPGDDLDAAVAYDAEARRLAAEIVASSSPGAGTPP